MRSSSSRKPLAARVARCCCVAFALLLPDLAFAQVDAGNPAPDAGSVADAGEAADAGPAEVTTGIAQLQAADPISFKAALQKAEVTLGEPFLMSIEVRHAAKEKYSLPSDLHMKDFLIRDQSTEEHGETTKTSLFRLTLQPFKLGEQEVPAVHLLASTPDGERQLEIPPQKIKVNGVIDLSQGQPQMREDSRPLPTAFRWRHWPFLIVALVLAGLALAWYLVKRARTPVPVAPPKPRLPAYDEAVERLIALKRENLVAQGEQQTYYFRLSEIIREYIGRVYAFDALELTSDELLQELRKRATPGLDYDRFSLFLRESDLVKFAKNQPTDGECKTSMDVARAFVEKTRPLPEVATAGRSA
jgi:hypothetical protein